MSEEQLIEQLKQQGYTDIKVLNIDPENDPKPHTHDFETMHIILQGDLTITEQDGTANTHHAGERLHFPVGTTHTAQPGPDGCRSVIGMKK